MKTETLKLFESIQDNVNGNDEKINNLKMMDKVIRRLNDEEWMDAWLTNGIPDEASEEDYRDIALDDYDNIEKLFKKILHGTTKDEYDGLFNPTEDMIEFAKRYEPNINIIEEKKEVLGEAEETKYETFEDSGITFTEYSDSDIEAIKKLDSLPEVYVYDEIDLSWDEIDSEGAKNRFIKQCKQEGVKLLKLEDAKGTVVIVKGAPSVVAKVLTNNYSKSLQELAELTGSVAVATESNETNKEIIALDSYETAEDIKYGVENSGGLYQFIYDEWHNLPEEIRKEIALNAVYELNNDAKILEDLAERL